jgi:hypothetical protein
MLRAVQRNCYPKHAKLSAKLDGGRALRLLGGVLRREAVVGRRPLSGSFGRIRFADLAAGSPSMCWDCSLLCASTLASFWPRSAVVPALCCTGALVVTSVGWDEAARLSPSGFRSASHVLQLLFSPRFVLRVPLAEVGPCCRRGCLFRPRRLASALATRNEAA